MTEMNRNQLEILVGYAHEQGTIKRRMPLDQLFVDITQGRKRSDEIRMKSGCSLLGPGLRRTGPISNPQAAAPWPLAAASAVPVTVVRRN